MNPSFEQAISLLHSGQWQEAREIMQGILQVERSNEAAWLWYSVSLETNEQRIRALEVGLRLNPEAGRVRAALEKLRKAGAGEDVFSLWAAADENPYDPFPSFGGLTADETPFGTFSPASGKEAGEDPFRAFRPAARAEPEANPFGFSMTSGSDQAEDDPFRAFRASIEAGHEEDRSAPFLSPDEPEVDFFKSLRTTGAAEEENPFGVFTVPTTEGSAQDWGGWSPGSVFTDLPEDGGIGGVEEQHPAQPGKDADLLLPDRSLTPVGEGTPDRPADGWNALREEKPKIKPLKVQEERRRQKILGEIPSDPLPDEARRHRKSGKKSERNQMVLYAAVAAVGLLGIVVLLAGMLIALGVIR